MKFDRRTYRKARAKAVNDLHATLDAIVEFQQPRYRNHPAGKALLKAAYADYEAAYDKARLIVARGRREKKLWKM